MVCTRTALDSRQEEAIYLCLLVNTPTPIKAGREQCWTWAAQGNTWHPIALKIFYEFLLTRMCLKDVYSSGASQGDHPVFAPGWKVLWEVLCELVVLARWRTMQGSVKKRDQASDPQVGCVEDNCWGRENATGALLLRPDMHAIRERMQVNTRCWTNPSERF